MLRQSHRILVAAPFLSLLMTGALLAQSDKNAIMESLDRHASDYSLIAQRIWQLAEVGYQETKSSALLQSKLREVGFSIRGLGATEG